MKRGSLVVSILALGVLALGALRTEQVLAQPEEPETHARIVARTKPPDPPKPGKPKRDGILWRLS